MISVSDVRSSDIRFHYDLTTAFYRLLWGQHIDEPLAHVLDVASGITLPGPRGDSNYSDGLSGTQCRPVEGSEIWD